MTVPVLTPGVRGPHCLAPHRRRKRDVGNPRVGAVEQVAGLELLIGNVAIARALGPDPDIAAPLGEPRTVLVCEACAGKETSVYRLGLEG